jgi:hypothetical protein
VVARLIGELLGDRHALPACDQLAEVLIDLCHRHPGHGVLAPPTRPHRDLQPEQLAHRLRIRLEELEEVPTLHRQQVGVGRALEAAELLDDAGPAHRTRITVPRSHTTPRS